MKEEALNAIKTKIEKEFNKGKTNSVFLEKFIKKLMKRKDPITVEDALDVVSFLGHLQAPVDFHFLKEYCEQLEERPNIQFRQLQKIWDKAKEIRDDNSLGYVAVSIYKIQKKINSHIEPMTRLELLGELAKYMTTKVQANIDVYDQFHQDLNYYQRSINYSVKDEGTLHPFVRNLYIERQFEVSSPKRSFKELTDSLAKIDKDQYRGPEIERKILKIHFHLLEQEEDSIELLKEKHRFFRQLANDDSFPSAKMEKLEEMILDRDTSELKNLEEFAKYLNEFGRRWYIVLPKWLQKNNISIWETISSFNFTELLLSSKVWSPSRERTNKNFIFEERVKEVIEQKEEELQQEDALGLYLLLKDLAEKKIDPQIKLHIGSLIIKEVDWKDWEKYKNYFMALMKN